MPTTLTIGPERIVLTDGLQPFLLRTSRGTLFAQCQMSFPPGYKPAAHNAYPGAIGNIVSRDGGQTWALVTQIDADTPTLGPWEGSWFEAPGGRVIFFEWVAEGPDDNKIFHGKLWESTDELASFTGPSPFTVHIPNGRAGFDDGGHPYRAITFHRGVEQLPGGDLIAVVYGWLEGDDSPIGYMPKMKKTRAMLVRSSDMGRSWRFVATMAAPLEETEEGFNETTLVRVTRGAHKGRLVALLRAGSSNHAMYAVLSDDDGATWTPPRKLAITGVDPHIVEAHDGRLVGIAGRRHWDDAFSKLRGYQIIVSEDAGESWTLLGVWGLPEYADGYGITSYASICELSPGRFLALYDIGRWRQAVRYTASREVRLG